MKRAKKAAPPAVRTGPYDVRREPFESESRLVVLVTGPRYDDYIRVYLCERQSAAQKLAALLNAATELAADWRGMRTVGIFSNTDPEYDVRHSIVTLIANAIDGPRPDVMNRRRTPDARCAWCKPAPIADFVSRCVPATAPGKSANAPA